MTIGSKGLLLAGCTALLAFSSLVVVPAAQARLVGLGTIQDSANKTCPPGGTCTVQFTAASGATSGKNTFIETVSCWINVSRTTSAKSVISRLQLNQSHRDAVHVFLAPIQVVESNGSEQKHQVYVSGLNYFVPPGSKPQVIAEFDPSAPSPGVGMICAYTGKQDQ